jgi:hypothetical protein
MYAKGISNYFPKKRERIKKHRDPSLHPSLHQPSRGKKKKRGTKKEKTHSSNPFPPFNY